MNCKEIRELLPDLAAGMDATTLTLEVKKHIASCNDCATHLGELQKTMAVLDEWQAPEPSAYFDTRLQARLREEMARPQATWFHWLRRPAWAMSLAAVLFAGALTVGLSSKSYLIEMGSIQTNPPSPGLPVQPGTAVGDLQALDSNHDLYADFDMLDELQVQDDVTANP
ncbi:MAG: zf-HC2 domain-containing protein [Terriglobales bacterium]|jgi:predicted anti-sigma-YlaC factor YlaD